MRGPPRSIWGQAGAMRGFTQRTGLRIIGFVRGVFVITVLILSTYLPRVCMLACNVRPVSLSRTCFSRARLFIVTVSKTLTCHMFLTQILSSRQQAVGVVYAHPWIFSKPRLLDMLAAQHPLVERAMHTDTDPKQPFATAQQITQYRKLLTQQYTKRDALPGEACDIALLQEICTVCKGSCTCVQTCVIECLCAWKSARS